MSVRVMDWVFQHSTSKLGDRLVLLAIADNAADDGTHSWPSIKEIAAKTHMSSRACQYSIDRLEVAGELDIARHGGPGRVNSYAVLMAGAISAPSNICATQNPTVIDAKSDKVDAISFTGNRPRTVLEPSTNTHKARARKISEKPKFRPRNHQDLPPGMVHDLEILHRNWPLTYITDQIDFALDHKASNKVTSRWDMYLRNWLENAHGPGTGATGLRSQNGGTGAAMPLLEAEPWPPPPTRNGPWRIQEDGSAISPMGTIKYPPREGEKE